MKNKQIYIFGLTGSIGMGKSVAAGIFKSLGVMVFDSDKEVHNILSNNQSVISMIKGKFPEVIVNNQISRSLLGERAFSDEGALRYLERLIHPIVQNKQKSFIESSKNRNEKVVVLDIPLLFETGSQVNCDAVILVSAPKDIQKERVLSRKNMSELKFQAILKTQMSDGQKRKKADFILETQHGFEKTFSDISCLVKNVERSLRSGLKPVKRPEIQ